MVGKVAGFQPVIIGVKQEWDKNSLSFTATKVSLYAVNGILKLIATVGFIGISAGLGFLACGGASILITGNLPISIAAATAACVVGGLFFGMRLLPGAFNAIDYLTFTAVKKLSGTDFT